MKHDRNQNQENKHRILKHVGMTCLVGMIAAMSVHNFLFVDALSSDENTSTEFVSDETDVETDTEFTDVVATTSSDASEASYLDDNISDEELLPDELETANTTNNDVSEVSDESVNDNTNDVTSDDENQSVLYAILYRSGELHFSYQYLITDDVLQVYDVPILCDSETDVPWYQNRLNIRSVTSDDIVLPNDTSYWFYDCKNLVTLDMSKFDMKDVTQMCYMFDGCNNLQQVSIGENFRFVGDDSSLPMLDGKEWVNTSGDRFTSDSIPSNQSGVYTNELIKYQIAFDANRGTGTMSNQVFDYDVSEALTANIFVRKGYVFMGWNTNPDGNGISYSDEQFVQNLIDTSDVLTLYAIWRPITCTIRYDSNQGFGLMLDTKLIYGKNDVIPKNVFLREGYAFKGWYVSRNHDGVTEWLCKNTWIDDESDKDLLIDNAHMNFTYVDKDVITLHAVWMPVESKDDNILSADVDTDDNKSFIDAATDDNEVVDEKLDVNDKVDKTDNSELSELILDAVMRSDETSENTLMSKLSEYAEASVTDNSATNDFSIAAYNSIVPTSADTNVDVMYMFVLVGGVAALFMFIVLYRKSFHK